MGADTKKLRNRIKSVNSTLHLTKAMGLVASSKIRRANELNAKSREYSTALNETVKQLSASDECSKSPYMRTVDTKKTKLIVIAGDRGLAGGYNANIFRFMRDFPDAEIIPIGKRAADRFGGDAVYAEKFGFTEANELAKSICADFCDGKFDRFGIVGTKYVSMMSQVPYIEWLLPLVREENADRHSAIFEPDELTVLNRAVPEYISGKIIAAVRESFASEVAARRMAMDSAGKNAQMMIDDLGLAYNRARQGAITQEITEIVAGSDS